MGFKLFMYVQVGGMNQKNTYSVDVSAASPFYRKSCIGSVSISVYLSVCLSICELVCVRVDTKEVVLRVYRGGTLSV